MTTDLVVRRLSTHEEFEACVTLQRQIWGDDYNDRVPAAILKISQRVGGITAGAFDASGRLAGFVYGLTGVERGRLVHWSHMLAVHEDFRNRGVGRRLKEFQRAEVRGAGVEVIYWTYDPLMARNAHFNLNRLGARVVEYVPDMYASTGSPLHISGTDRFVVAWSVGHGPSGAAEGVGQGSVPPGADSWPVVNAVPLVGAGSPNLGAAVARSGAGGQDLTAAGAAVAVAPDVFVRDAGTGIPSTPAGVRIEIPLDLEGIREVELARAWRASTRAAFLEYLARGYEVLGLQQIGDRCFYLLAGPGSASGEAAR